jgi:hypothetical protein
MTGYEEYNYPAFTEACRILRMNSLRIVSPHEVPWPDDHETMDVETLWEYMMKETKLLLDEAGGVILLPGWAHSRGVLIELGIAQERKLPVLFMSATELVVMA